MSAFETLSPVRGFRPVRVRPGPENVEHGVHRALGRGRRQPRPFSDAPFEPRSVHGASPAFRLVVGTSIPIPGPTTDRLNAHEGAPRAWSAPRLRRPLQDALDGIPVQSALFRDWSTLTDAKLLARARSGGFTVLLTTDKRLAYEQAPLSLAVIALDDNRWFALRFCSWLGGVAPGTRINGGKPLPGAQAVNPAGAAHGSLVSTKEPDLHRRQTSGPSCLKGHPRRDHRPRTGLLDLPDGHAGPMSKRGRRSTKNGASTALFRTCIESPRLPARLAPRRPGRAQRQNAARVGVSYSRGA